MRRLYGAALERLLDAELRVGRTLVGPQRDDLQVSLHGKDASTHASAGELRRVAFALVVAAAEVAAAAAGGTMLFLVDDVEAEFDEQRLHHILRYLAGTAQTLVATSKVDLAGRYAPLGRLLLVDQGRIREA